MLTFLSIKCLHFFRLPKMHSWLNALLKNNKLEKKEKKEGSKGNTHLMHNPSPIIQTRSLIQAGDTREQPWIPRIPTARGSRRCLGLNSACPSDKMIVPTSSCPIPSPHWLLTWSFTCFHLPSCQTSLVMQHPPYLNLLLQLIRSLEKL